jgi:hypothetical protein
MGGDMEEKQAGELSKKLYLLLSGTIFLLVGLLHLLRLVYHWPVLVDSREIPYALSYVGFPVAIAYAVWAWWLWRRSAGRCRRARLAGRGEAGWRR